MSEARASSDTRKSARKRATQRWIAPRSGGYRPGEFSSRPVPVAKDALPPAGDGGVGKAAGR